MGSSKIRLSLSKAEDNSVARAGQGWTQLSRINETLILGARVDLEKHRRRTLPARKQLYPEIIIALSKAKSRAIKGF
jgi:hypothetical protein